MSKELERLKHIRDSWAQEHEIAVKTTNQANAHEKRALKRFKEADKAYRKVAQRELPSVEENK